MRNVGNTIRRQVDKSDQSPCVGRKQFEKATNMLTSEGYLEYQRYFEGSKLELAKSRSSRSRGQHHPLSNNNNNNIKSSVEYSSGVGDNSFRNRYVANSLHESGSARIADQSYLLAPSNHICSISQFSDGKAVNRSRTIEQNRERDETSRNNHSPAYQRLQQTQQQKKQLIQQSTSQHSDQESEYFRHSSNRRGIFARQGKRLLSLIKPTQSHSDLVSKQVDYKKEPIQGNNINNNLNDFQSNFKRRSEYNLIIEKEKHINSKISVDIGQVSSKNQFSFKLYCKLHGLKQQQQQQQPFGSSVNLVMKQSPIRSGNSPPPSCQQYQHLSVKQSFSQSIPQSFRNTSKDEESYDNNDIKNSGMFPDIDSNDCITTANGGSQKMNLLMKETSKRENLPEQNKSVVYLNQPKNLIDYLNCQRMEESQMEKRCTSGKRQRYSQCTINRMSAIEKVLASDGKTNNMPNEIQRKRSLTRENELGEIKASVKRIKLKKLAAVLAHQELFMNGSQLGAVQAFRQVISGNNSSDEGDQRQKSKDKKNHQQNEIRNQSDKEIQFEGVLKRNKQDIMNHGETTSCQFFQLQQYYNKKYEKQLQEYSQSSSSLQLKQHDSLLNGNSQLQNESINQEMLNQKQSQDNYQQQQQEQNKQLPQLQSTSLLKLKSAQIESIDSSIRFLHQSSSSDIKEQSKQDNFNIPLKYQYPHRNLASNIKYFPNSLICKQIEKKQKRVKHEKGFEQLQPWDDQTNFNESNFFTKTTGGEKQ